MLKNLARKLTIGAALLALAAPVAFAEQTGGDPEPGVTQTTVAQVILAYLGLS
jgi:hypothetical protein